MLWLHISELSWVGNGDVMKVMIKIMIPILYWRRPYILLKSKFRI